MMLTLGVGLGNTKAIMFGLSFEHILVLGIVLLIFGPRRLPELGNTMGKAIKNFKDAISGVEEAKYRKIDGEEKPSETASADKSSSNPDEPTQKS